MKIYDIAKELFSTEVFPGDPEPSVTSFFSVSEGAPCNLSVLEMGSHNGTHMDAPYHFVQEGRQVHELSMEQCIGPCEVIELSGDVTRENLQMKVGADCRKLLIKGGIHITTEAAEYLAESAVELIGVEDATVGDSENGHDVHYVLLSADMIILENLDLMDVRAGVYFLAAQPLYIKGLDGSPCRPVLIEAGGEL